MAEGGIQPISENDYQEQLDEITALESIYGSVGQFIVTSTPHDYVGSFTFEVEIPVHISEEGITLEVWLPNTPLSATEVEALLPPVKRPHYNRSQSGFVWEMVSGQRLHCSLRVSALNPLRLRVTFPPSYPSLEQPVYNLTSLWLTDSQLAVLCQQLNQLWQVGMPVIFTWVDWLQNNTLSCLGVEKTLVLTQSDLEDDESCQRDPGSLPTCLPLHQAVLSILCYNYEQEVAVFRGQVHECGVCFEVKSGAEFFLLPECGHKICDQCLQEFCQVHVSQGTVQQLCCPEDKCEGTIPPHMIRAVLGDDAYERWESLLVQRALDGMGDIIWCPRCNQAVVKEPEATLNLGHCLNCSYSFCTECKESWHAGQCQTILDHLQNVNGDLRKKLARKIARGEQLDEEDIDGLSKSTLTVLKRKSKEYLTVALIKNITKPCPNCGVKIQKNGGCNKMTCFKCSTAFCWLCNAKINGYDHFSSTKCETFTTAIEIATRVRPREAHEGQVELEKQLAAGGKEALKKLANCPRCKQRNLKSGRNNHMQCWQCHTPFCFLCKGKLDNSGSIIAHFRSPSPCIQHSD